MNLDSTFSALADPTRRAILNHLSKQDASVLELAKPFDISLPAISKHLRVLENANLILRKKEGRVHRIRLNPSPLQAASEWIESYRVFWQQAFSRIERYMQEESWNQKTSYKSGEPLTPTLKKSSKHGQKRNTSAGGSRKMRNTKS